MANNACPVPVPERLHGSPVELLQLCPLRVSHQTRPDWLLSTATATKTTEGPAVTQPELAPPTEVACNCVLKGRFRDSLINRCSYNCDDPSSLCFDCSKPLVAQCLLVSRTYYLP